VIERGRPAAVRNKRVSAAAYARVNISMCGWSVTIAPSTADCEADPWRDDVDARSQDDPLAGNLQEGLTDRAALMSIAERERALVEIHRRGSR
jgi:hypothetical protein